MIRKLFLFSFLLIPLFFTLLHSCSKDKNEEGATDPVLNITYPDNDSKFNMGGDNHINFTGSVSDDIELKKLVITLTWHGETKSSEIDGDGAVTGINDPWEDQIETITLTGKLQSFTNKDVFSSPIPDNIKPGFYDLSFELTNAAEKSVSAEFVIEIY